MTYTVEYYQNLVTSEHKGSEKYMSWLGAMIEPFTVIQSVMDNFVPNFDVDVAVGKQLDAVGKWVGVSRFLREPITDVYFTFDNADLGFDRSIFKGPFSPDSGVVRMPDYIYRFMIKFKILSNKWDGTIPTAYADFQKVFGSDSHVFIVDNQDMSMSIGIVGLTLGPLGVGILEQGYFPFRPEGVKIMEYIIHPLGKKIFAFDLASEIYGGFDVGYFPLVIIPN
jgi:hypothetical protein